MLNNASAAVFPWICAGSFAGPTIVKKLYAMIFLFTPNPPFKILALLRAREPGQCQRLRFPLVV